MYLVDTNIWLERLLGQAKSEAVGKFLDHVSSDQLFITDFALHSIGVILTRLQKGYVFIRFLDDLLINSSVSIITLDVDELKNIVAVMAESKLDFDDAYQYIALQRGGFTLVSFDSDFDKTSIGRKSPEDILEEAKAPPSNRRVLQ